MAIFSDYPNKPNPLGRKLNPNSHNLVSEYEGTARVCADLNATTIAGTTLRLYLTGSRTDLKTKCLNPFDQYLLVQKMRLHASEQIEEIIRHQVLTLISNPNEDMDWQEVAESTQSCLEIVGTAYWWVPLNKLGVPQSIIPLLPQMYRPVYEDKRFVGLAEYGSTSIKYRREELIVFRMNNLKGGIEGLSPLHSVWEQVSIDSKIDARMADMIDNNARPDIIISPKSEDSIWTDDVKERYKLEFNQEFSGSGSGKSWFADGDIDINTLNFSPVDTAIFEHKKISKELICNAFNVPPALLGGGQFNRATLDAAKEQHAVSMEYRARKFAGRMTKFLLPMFDGTENMFFAFDDISPENRLEKVNELNTLRNAQIITGNEARFEIGLAPHPDADTLHPIVPGLDVGGTPTEEETVTDELIPVEQPVEEKPQDQAMNGAQIGSMVDIIANVREGIIPVDSALGILQAAYPALSEQQIDSIINPLRDLPIIQEEKPESEPEPEPISEPEPELQLEEKKIPDHIRQEMKVKAKTKNLKTGLVPNGDELKDICVDFYNRKRIEVIGDLDKGDLDKGITKSLPTKFVPLESWTDDLSEKCRPVVEFYYESEAKSLLERIGASPDVFSVTNPETVKAIDKIVYAFCQSTVESTTKSLNDALTQLRDELSQGLETGDSIQLMTKKVNDIFEGLTKNHAQMIARTESARAHHMGFIQGCKDSGVVSGLKWLASPDDPDGRCKELDGKVVKLDGSFITGQSNKPEYSNIQMPPLHPRCKCQLLAVIDD
ncbi:Phage portal protein [Polystyrenella longa]|uniref:Phage portal protein n=1 Tax=Polystyrenella longa TaxID=2528007 RepID=A0A518CQQ0_9PLAN|nr:phage portal protein [Polystyrenella longa]QDU81551.1 Phage portal protein [Polystyrenella longa]